LQNLEVLEVCVFSVDVELHTSHWDIKVNAIEDLAKSGAVVRLGQHPSERTG
jgi:hypothetical protein